MSSQPARKLFKRPSFALTATQSETDDAATARDDNFFSRADPSFNIDSIVKKQKQSRKLERTKEHVDERSSSIHHDNQDEAPHKLKRRRLSYEKEVKETNYNEISTVIDNTELKSRSASSNCTEGKPELLPMDSPVNSPSNKLQDLPRLPNEDQCHIMRHANPLLASYTDEELRKLTYQKWEQDRNDDKSVQSPSDFDAKRSSSIYSEVVTVVQTPPSPSQQLLVSMEKQTTNWQRGDASPVSQKDLIGLGGDDKFVEEEKSSKLYARSGETHSNDSKDSNMDFSAVNFETNPDDDDEMIEQIQKVRSQMQESRMKSNSLLDPSAAGDIGSPREYVVTKEKPLIYYWITSEIPGTFELKFKRRSNQRMKEVRQYWCRQNDLEDVNRKDKVVLIWVDQVWYDAMSAVDFKIGVDKFGCPLDYESEDYHGEDPYNGHIHLVAMLESQWEESRGRKLHGNGEEKSEKQDEASDRTSCEQNTAATQQLPEEERIRIEVRSKSYSEQKLSVTPSTTIMSISNAYRKMSKMPNGRMVALILDGYLLQPNSTVGQNRINDEEIIDAHVK